MKLDICLRPVKNQFKMEKYLNLKLETPRLRKHRGCLQDIGVGETVQKDANSTRTCHKQSTDEFHENGKFPHSRGSNQQSLQTAHRREDKLYQLHVRQGVNIHKGLQTLDIKEIKLPITKWANGLNRHFSKTKEHKWPITVFTNAQYP